MPDSLKKQAISSLFWSSLDKIGVQVIQLVVSVITARILCPKDFGLIGALSIFILISNMLVISGFASALIRKEHVSREEYSAVFFFNTFVSAVLYVILYFCAPLIAGFFKMPELTNLSRLVFTSIILYSFSIIQISRLSREFKFKKLAAANITSFTLSGIITIILATHGFAYWAVAWQQVLTVGFTMIILWVTNPIKISLNPDFGFIKSSFKFSSTLLLTGFFNIITSNIYNVIIGKIYRVNELGYYSQARRYQQIPTTVFTQILQSVALPTFSKLNTDKERQLLYLRKMIRIAAFLIFPATAILIGLARPIIEIILSEKWLPSAFYFQLLLVGAVVFTFHTLFIQLFVAVGKVNKYFMLEQINNALVLISIPIFFGSINHLLIGFAAANIISYFIDIFVVNKQTKYRPLTHLKDIAPYAALSVGVYLIVYLGGMIPGNLYIKTILLAATAGVFYFLMLYLLGSAVFKELLSLIKKRNKDDISSEELELNK